MPIVSIQLSQGIKITTSEGKKKKHKTRLVTIQQEARKDLEQAFPHYPKIKIKNFIYHLVVKQLDMLPLPKKLISCINKNKNA